MAGWLHGPSLEAMVRNEENMELGDQVSSAYTFLL